ncbi:hypothetical protein EHS25_008258 [Saitozyma podzolica]|uniref:Major facilitator superfamily (MFS) profile domain-containing protein n=1 Tax=Saitozyma podzolica TaxID=1890683 RepID=A0A427YNV5_9TREE|nr:hypothetical protein EHS25_008258 [Saitozyma podzolica]
MSKPTFSRRLAVAVWGEKAESKVERKLVAKIDAVILTYCCVSFFFNYLDRAALANAYVSGMQKDLKFVGNQYNVVVTCLTVGYIIGGPIHAVAIQKIAPRWWFSTMCLLWAGLTMCCAAAQKYQDLCVIRFFQGMVEASTYSGTQYVIGSWYKPEEMGKRTGLFAASGMAGTMFSGIMMTAIYKTVDGHAGLAGWRWLFIILGLITIPIALFGFALFPDLPETTTARWLTTEEKELAVSRLPPKRNGAGHSIGWDLIRRVLLSPAFYVFTMLWVVGGALEAFSTQSCMLLMMNALGFSVPQKNTYTLGITAVGIFCTLLTSVLIDFSGKHVPWGLVACGLQLIPCIILLCWNQVSVGAKLAAYYIAGSAYMIQPVIFTFANKTLGKTGDDAMRAMTLYAMNSMSSVLFAFWGLILYPATDAPRFFKGTIAMLVVSVVLALWIIITWRLEISINKKYLAAIEQSESRGKEEGLHGDGDGDDEKGYAGTGEKGVPHSVKEQPVATVL